MKQTSFAQAEFAAKKKTARRERFLAEMEQVAPWSRLLEVLQGIIKEHSSAAISQPDADQVTGYRTPSPCPGPP